MTPGTRGSEPEKPTAGRHARNPKCRLAVRSADRFITEQIAAHAVRFEDERYAELAAFLLAPATVSTTTGHEPAEGNVMVWNTDTRQNCVRSVEKNSNGQILMPHEPITTDSVSPAGVFGRVQRGVQLAGGAVALAVIAGCSLFSPGADTAIPAFTCPDTNFVSYLGIDYSGTGRAEAIFEDRKTAIRSIVERTAQCDGELRVNSFSGASTQTYKLFDGSLRVEGHTGRAEQRKRDKLVDEVTDKIITELGSAGSVLSPDGSDITAQFTLVQEFVDQVLHREGDYTFEAYLLTDGIQTVGTALDPAVLTDESARELAEKALPVELPPDTVVKVAGLGKTAGTPAPTSVVEALRRFYITYCERTGASSCTAVVDYTA